MTPFQKKLRLQQKADVHAWKMIGFAKTDKSIQDYHALMSDKSVKIYKATVTSKGGWGTQLGRL